MIRKICIATLFVATAALGSAASAKHVHLKHLRTIAVETHSELDDLIARHAAANNVPEDLVRRIIKRESRGNPRVVSAGQLRPDADQARRPRARWATPAAPPACSMPTPT